MNLHHSKYFSLSYYKHERYHVLLDNLTPEDEFYGRAQAVLDQGAKIKLNTLSMRGKMYSDNRNHLDNPMG